MIYVPIKSSISLCVTSSFMILAIACHWLSSILFLAINVSFFISFLILTPLTRFHLRSPATKNLNQGENFRVESSLFHFISHNKLVWWDLNDLSTRSDSLVLQFLDAFTASFLTITNKRSSSVTVHLLSTRWNRCRCVPFLIKYKHTHHKKASNHHANLPLEMYSFTL